MAGGERLLERERELAAIEEGIARACGGDGRALLVEGQPGLGKTRLAWAAANRAAEREMLVLRARAAELEQELGWGVVRTLFGPVLAGPARREALLQGAARGQSRSSAAPSPRPAEAPSIQSSTACTG